MAATTPSFFIVGAPKAGTTAFYVYLRQHPEIFMPEDAKEPHFFSPELKHPAFVQDPDEYAALFAAAKAHQRTGEASVLYLYSEQAATLIRQQSPGARIIIMLRDQVDMIYALHNEHRVGGMEKYRRFEDALAAEPRREARQESVPARVSPDLFLYRKIGTYSPQVQRYLQIFPREQILFIFFEDFVKDTAGEYRRTLEFLGVDPSFAPEFPRVNESRCVRNSILQRILLARPRFLQKMARAMSPQKLRHGILNLAISLNAPLARRPTLDAGTRSELIDYFAADTERLAKLTGKDLSSWSSYRATSVEPAFDRAATDLSAIATTYSGVRE
jgi:hypothetical protein